MRVNVRIWEFLDRQTGTVFSSRGGQEKMMSKVQCLFWSKNCTTERRGGEKGRECKIQKKTHRTFDIIFSWSPAYAGLVSGFADSICQSDLASAGRTAEVFPALLLKSPRWMHNMKERVSEILKVRTLECVFVTNYDWCRRAIIPSIPRMPPAWMATKTAAGQEMRTSKK